MSDGSLPTVGQIFANHEEIVAEYNLHYPGVKGFFPQRKIRQVIDRASERDDPFEQAAVFLKQLPMIHIFEDGNKRTAWLTAVELLDRNGLECTPGDSEAERVMKRRQRYSVEELAEWLSSGEIDRERLF